MNRNHTEKNSYNTIHDIDEKNKTLTAFKIMRSVSRLDWWRRSVSSSFPLDAEEDVQV